MYVITHHHDYDEVLLGPITWNPRFIASVLRTDLDLSFTPNIVASDEQKVPYEVLPNVWIRRVTNVSEDHNPKLHTLIGPYWVYNGTEATAEYRKQDKPLEIVKAELKQIVTANRYQKEVAGVKVTIQGVEVTVDTARDNRDVFVQKYLLMSDTDTVDWKFPETWLTLTKADLGIAVQGGVTHVQSQFSWENSKFNEIDACTTLEELDAVILE